jgi:hypothetical protein
MAHLKRYSDQLLQQTQLNSSHVSLITKILIFVGICIIVVLFMQLIKFSCNIFIKYRSNVSAKKTLPVGEIIKFHPQNVQNIL